MRHAKSHATKPPAHHPLHRILYIDDDRDILTLTRFALEKIGGFHVDICHSGSKGMAAAEASHPDLIMLDVMMPDMDGPSLLRALKKNASLCDTPVVFMTARIQPAEIDKYSALGAVGVIPKPFNPVTLSKDIEALWQSHQRQSHSASACDIEDLRQHYISNLPAKRAEFEAFLRRVRVRRTTPTEIEKIERLAHNLAGSGATYGYRSLSKSARILEEMLTHAPHSPKLSMTINKLLASIDRIIITPSPNPCFGG